MSSTFTLPISTPVANVLRFLLLEYLFLKGTAWVVENSAAVVAARRQRNQQPVVYHEGWFTFFLLPYRIKETSWMAMAFLTLVVVGLNAFLLLFEFGFDSVVLSAGHVTSWQEVRSSGVGSGVSRPLPSQYHDLRWIDRLQQLHDGCVVRNGYLFTVRNGYIENSPVLEKLDSIHLNPVKCESATVQMDLSAPEPVLGQDDLLGLDITPQQVRFRISFAGLSVTPEPFLESYLDVQLVDFGPTAFRRMAGQGGQYDMTVRGKLHLRRLTTDPNSWLVRFNSTNNATYYPRQFFESSNDFYSFDIVGSCTGDDVSTFEGGELPDERLTCVLSDSGANRFILPAQLYGGPLPPGYVDVGGGRLEARAVSAGRALYLVATAGVFRAEILDRGDAARDKDHVAAAKLHRLRTRGVSNAMYETAISSFFPSAVRSLSAVLVYGATDLTQAPVREATQEDERATVALWTLLVTATAVGALCVAAGTLCCADTSRSSGTTVQPHQDDDDEAPPPRQASRATIVASLRPVRRRQEDGPMPPVTYNHLVSLVDPLATSLRTGEPLSEFPVVTPPPPEKDKIKDATTTTTRRTGVVDKDNENEDARSV